MRIQHNITALNAYRNYNTNTSALSKNLEKLSSGYKINRAGDDAAGLAISEKMRAQITGLSAAQKNVKDGISLVKTAEGAMQEIHDMLNRMDYLATQSANGTYDNEVDRANLQKEVDALRSEINRIADSSNFNGINLLDGDLAGKSTSALGAATAQLLASVDGTPASKAGAAEISLKLSNNAATASSPLESVTAQDGNGSNVVPATKAEITLTVGGIKGDPAAKIKIKGKVNGTALDAAGADTIDVDGGKWKAGDYLEIEAGGKTYKFTFDNSETGHDAADGWVTATSATAINTELEKHGLAFNSTTATAAYAHVTKAEISGFNGGSKIEAGVTTITALKALQITGETEDTVDNLFDIKVNGSEQADSYVIKNGDKITLTAKKAGAMATDANKAFDKLGNLTADAPTGATGDAATALAGSVKAVNGKNDDYATPATPQTEYTLTFNIDELAGGKKITIGSKSLEFKALDPSVASATTGNAMVINLNQPDDDANGTSKDEIVDDIKTALGNLFGTTDFDTGVMTDNGDGTYTYSIKSKIGSDDTATNGHIVAANLGEVRVFQANVDGSETEITDTDKAISSTYTPAKEIDTSAPSKSAFAKVTYEIETAKIKAGNKLTIGGVEVKIAAATDAKKGEVSATAATFAADLAKVLEENGYPAGKVTVTNDTANNKIKLEIEGTTVGESAADLKKGAGAVSLLDAETAPASEATVAGVADMKITAGTTDIATIKNAAMPDNADGDPVALKDLFDITVNGSAKADNYVIQEGDEIKFTAKKNGQLSDAVMNKFKFEGKIDKLSSKNGFDEGSNASGDKTHYELDIDVTKVQGGASFTFGNVNGKSYTFDLSYDDDPTKNNTIGDEDNTDLAGNGERTTINLYGLTNAEAQEKIFEQVKAKMGTDFNVTRAISGNTVTLALDAKEEGAQYNLGNIRVSSQSGALTRPVYNPAGGNANGVPGTKAQVTYKFDVSQLQLGDQLTVGGTTITIGEETKKTVENGVVKHSVSLADAQADPNEIVKVLESAGYQSGQVRFDTTKNEVTITGVANGETAAKLAAGGGAINVSNANRSMTEGGLELQIGDTNDSFNRISVSIGDMHTKSMGTTGGKSIADISVATQDGAAEAIQVIKDAINYVSSVRGDLGATQNRLEHTANNLSVMAENIQDAESTIRDTDVAEEMMSYVKNNILVQSAQAMLAQANQLPQGVLQLLG